MTGRRLLLLCWVLAFAAPAAATARVVLLVARELRSPGVAAGEKLLPGLCFTYAGASSAKTNSVGATELPVPVGLRVGQQIEISFVPCSKRAEDWILVNSMINVPDPSEPVHVVLMSRRVARKMFAEASNPKAITAGRSERTSEDAKRDLLAAAARYGVTSEKELETALASFAETKDLTDRAIALYFQGQYSQVEQLLKEPTEKAERDLAERLRYLGASQFKQAKYSAAVDSFRKALALRCEDTALLRWLGKAFYKLADWTEAEPLMRRALAINEKSYGAEHPAAAIDLNNLAQLLQDTNRFGEAEPLMRRVLAIDEKSYGPEHPEVAPDLNNLAMLLQATNRLSDAEPLMRRTLAIDEKSYGPEHTDVARDLNNLAQLLQATNRSSDAEPLLRRALAIFFDFARRTGHEHPNLRTVMANYSALLHAMGKSDAEIQAAIKSLSNPSRPGEGK
jgi:tetratricopeptide (TPR) repeat protein